jgi:hypothetical protein
VLLHLLHVLLQLRYSPLCGFSTRSLLCRCLAAACYSHCSFLHLALKLAQLLLCCCQLLLQVLHGLLPCNSNRQLLLLLLLELLLELLPCFCKLLLQLHQLLRPLP